MGVAFMVSALLVAGTDWATRVLIARRLGMNAVGLYSATWTLSSLYVGVVLGAMGADFYPRLTAVARDDAAVNQLVNEQTEMGILIAMPGILVTLALAPWVLRVFYSEAFMPAVEVIRWQILGIALRVVSWPMGFIQLSRAMPKLFMITETIFAAANVFFLFVCMKLWGLDGVGISFFALYVIYSITMFGVCNRITGFWWSKKSLFVILFACCMLTTVLLMVRMLPGDIGLVCALIVTAAASAGCLFELQLLLKFDMKRLMPAGINWVKTKSKKIQV